MTAPLFSVALLSAGSRDVESLPSYMRRVAAVHSVTVGTFLKWLYMWHGQQSSPDTPLPFQATDPGPLGHYVRPNVMTSRLCESLSMATGQRNLQSGTFLCLIDALDRCMGSFSTNLRWCPTCLGEFVDSGVDPHLKLEWSLADIRRCTRHGIALVDCCPHCGHHQNGVGKYVSAAQCMRCSRSLIEESLPESETGRWQVECADLFDLLETIGANPTLQFPASGVRIALQELVDRAWAREEELRLWSILPRDQCLAITTGVVPVTLKRVRALATVLGANITDLLGGSVGQTPGLLDPAWTPKLPPPVRHKPRLAKETLKSMLRSINHALSAKGSDAPMPLAAVARDLGISTGGLRYHFPIQSQEILRRYDAWRKKEAARKELEAKLHVAHLHSEHKAKNQAPLSNKKALRILRTQTRLPKDILRREIALANAATLGL